MMHLSYLAALMIALGGLAVLDVKYRLAFWHNARQASLALGCSVVIFIIWDALGIGLGIFRHGNSPYSLPFTLAPEFPVEEVVFLFLLCYSTLIIYRGVSKWRSRT